MLVKFVAEGAGAYLPFFTDKSDLILHIESQPVNIMGGIHSIQERQNQRLFFLFSFLFFFDCKSCLLCELQLVLATPVSARYLCERH